MRFTQFASITCTLIAVTLAAPAAANITFHEIALWQQHTQTSDSQPGAPSSYLFTARVFANTANEVMNGTVDTPSNTSHALSPSGAFASVFADGSHGSLASLTGAYGPGTYDFNLTDGPHAGETDSVVFGNPGWADSTPYLTGTTYSDLQGMDVTQAFNITWNTWNSTGDATSRQTYFYLFDVTANANVYGNQGNPNSFTGITINPNTLIAGHTYRYSLNFGALTQSQSQGDFNPSFATASMYVTTDGFFTTAVPEPVTSLLLAPGLVWLARRQRSA